MKPTKSADKQEPCRVSVYYRSGAKVAGAAEAAVRAVEMCGAKKGVTVNLIFTGDAHIKKINAGFRGKNRATDVISFPYAGGGDVFISLQTAKRQAKEAGVRAEDEIRSLIVHGVLHVMGYDHEKRSDKGRMMRKQKAVLKKIKAGKVV